MLTQKEKESEIATPLMQALATKFRFSWWIGPPIAASYAVYYFFKGNYPAVLGLVFFLVIDSYVLFQLFFKKKSLMRVANILVFGMFIANIVPLYTSENIYVQLQWFIVFPFLYFHITGYKNGVRWAVIYYSTAALMYFISEKHIPADLLISAITASLILTVLLAYYMKINESLNRGRIDSISVFSHEIDIAQKFQKAISPDGEIRLNNIVTGIRYIPYYGLSGDVFDVYQMENTKVRIFIADISGHGVQSSLLGMSLKTIYYNFRDKKISPNILLEKLNIFFFENFSLKGEFATAFIMDIDPEKKTMAYSSAGHLPQIRFSDKENRHLRTEGKPLGVTRQSNYILSKESYEAGEQLLLFTDGLTEGLHSAGHDQEYSTLKEIIFPFLHLAPVELLDSLFKKIEELRYPQAPQDDIAIISIKL